MRILSILIAPVAILSASVSAQQTPQAALDGLLATERGLSEAAAKLGPAEGIASLIGPEGALITPKGVVRGRDAALESLRKNAANDGQRARWKSIKGGVSADG